MNSCTGGIRLACPDGGPLGRVGSGGWPQVVGGLAPPAIRVGGELMGAGLAKGSGPGQLASQPHPLVKLLVKGNNLYISLLLYRIGREGEIHREKH